MAHAIISVQQPHLLTAVQHPRRVAEHPAAAVGHLRPVVRERVPPRCSGCGRRCHGDAGDLEEGGSRVQFNRHFEFMA